MKVKSYMIVLCLFHTITFTGQDHQFKSWTAVDYGLDLTKKWEIDFGLQLRLKENLETIDSYLAQSETTFKPLKRLKLLLQLRYYKKNDNQGNRQGYDNFFRYRIGIQKQFKLKPGTFNLRLAYQNRLSLDRNRFESEEEWLDYGKRSKKVFRLKPSIHLKIKNWPYDPLFYVEYFQEMDDSGISLSENRERAYRYGFGTRVKLSKNQILSVIYFYEKSESLSHSNQYASVLSVKYIFKNKKKDKPTKQTT